MFSSNANANNNVTQRAPCDDETTPQISTLRREKDNFYKYKTAEQVSKHLARSSHRPHQFLVGDTNNDDTHAMTHRRTAPPSGEQRQLSPPLIPKGVVSHARKRYSSASSSKRSSFDTLSTGSQGSRSSPIRAGGAPPARRVSFKTHTHTYQHRYRGRDKEFVGGGPGGAGAVSGVSKVAKLTQQFNEIIQKDDKLLEEVRRNKGVLMARGGHVYKVIAATPTPPEAPSFTVITTACPTKPPAAASPLYSTVQKNIRKFEKVSEKPSVPEKSQLVMRMQREHWAKMLAKRNENRATSSDEAPGNLAMVQEETPAPDATKSVVYAELAQSTYTPSVTEVPEVPQPQPNRPEEQPRAVPSANGNNNESPTDGETKPKDRRSKYSLIYEKLRLRPAKAKAKAKEAPAEQPRDDSTSRLLDALDVVDQRLRVLTEDSAPDAVLVVHRNEDFEKRLVPNSSFVHQHSQSGDGGRSASPRELLAQAVNVALVNSIEGEQMIMEQKELQAVQRCSGASDVTVAEEACETAYQDYEIIETRDCCPPATPIESFVYRQINATTTTTTTIETESVPRGDADNIYQTIVEAVVTPDDYEPIAEPPPFDHDYEVCEVPPLQVRNTTDELPELPKPQRRLPPSRTPPSRPAPKVDAASVDDHNDDDDEHHYYADDENIYDTIKIGGSHCYESLPPPIDAVPSPNGAPHLTEVRGKNLSTRNSDCSSIASNCYESIVQYCRHHNPGRLYQSSTTTTVHATSSSGGSTLTISSDHKTNSLYEGSLLAQHAAADGLLMELHHHHHHHYHHHHSNNNNNNNGISSTALPQPQQKGPTITPSTSENSDGWIDISDAEGNTVAQPQFIVVRERSKVHRSPDWSKRVREGRLRQNKSGSEDDSDHLYETLPVPGSRRPANRVVRRASSNRKRCTNEPWRPNGFPAFPEDRGERPAASVLPPAAESDSFATDSEEGEHEQATSLYADSGVDMRRLPPPPTPASNSVYSLVRKMKNFITPGSKNKTPKAAKKSVGSLPDNLYENSEFLKQAEPRLGVAAPEAPPPVPPASGDEKSAYGLATAKSKAGRSFKSRLRKSLVGSPFESSAMTPARSTFYINEPSHYADSGGDLDSGLSEKASSGDLPPPLTQPSATSLTTPPTKGAEPTKFLTVMRKSKKESASAANQQRRRTLMGIRPDVPPPPPPDDKRGSAQRREALSTTSWYAECGVFELAAGDLHADEPSLKGIPTQNGYGVGGGAISPSRTTSWYAESGLYQTSAGSVASSSGSSGVSTGNEGGPGDDLPHGVFSNEPLYQIYTAAKVEQSISRDMDEVSTDGYEDIEHPPDVAATLPVDEPGHQKRSRPTALQLVEPKNGPSRTLWSELPEVINSGILPKLTPRERALQEAKFEVITSEASYLKSLNLLRSHYMRDPLFGDGQLVGEADKQALFANILPVIECSERLLMQLEHCWQDDVRLGGMSERIYRIAEQQFHVYVAFCEQQGHMDRTLRLLKEQKRSFAQRLERLETSSVCCGLNLHSFLMLPMQRITRLPLLIDAVFSKTSPHDGDYDSWKMTLAIMNKIVGQCNEAANRFEQAYEIERIAGQLEYPGHIRALPLAAGPKARRFLVKKGELTHLVWRGDDAGKLTFGKKFTKAPVYAFLFSDLLVLTKQRQPHQQYHVFDYCHRNFLTICAPDTLTQLPTKDMHSAAAKNLILMTLLENHDKKTVELVLSCPSVSEQQRWLQAMRPPEAENPGEKLYEQWDCPQVIAKHAYEAQEPDALDLEISDVVNVSRKLPDGWFYGERIRDGAMGWFPGNYTEEVNSAHVRARNLKQRHRLLTFTANYIEMQKRK